MPRPARIALLCLLALVVAAPAQAKVPKAPAGLGLYKPPKHLGPGKHGDLIWARRVKSPLAQASRTWVLLYRSTSVHGRAIGVSGMVFLPRRKAPKRGWPVVSWAHGTSGIADICAPSRDPGGPYTAYLKPQLNAWLKKGYAIANTDYEGLGTPGVHPYLVGRSEGRGVVDVVRATRQLDRRVGKRYVIAGHSQGGHAALWAAGLASKWAPELQLRGVAAFAPASHLGVLSRALPALTTPSPLSAIAGLVLRGLAAVYPAIKPSELASDEFLARLPRADHACIDQLYGSDTLGGLAPSQIARPGADLGTLNRILDAQNPALKIPAPVLLAQGAADSTVPPSLTAELNTELHAKGDKVTYATYAGVGHVGIVAAADARTRRFLSRRLR